MSAFANDAAARATDALLHANGVSVSLRIPVPATAGDDAEQLGLASPQFQDVALGRGIFRRMENARVLLLSASAVDRACEASGAAAAEAMFGGAAGVLVGDELHSIAGWAALHCDGSVYGYALTVANRVG